MLMLSLLLDSFPSGSALSAIIWYLSIDCRIGVVTLNSVYSMNPFKLPATGDSNEALYFVEVCVTFFKSNFFNNCFLFALLYLTFLMEVYSENDIQYKSFILVIFLFDFIFVEGYTSDHVKIVHSYPDRNYNYNVIII